MHRYLSLPRILLLLLIIGAVGLALSGQSHTASSSSEPELRPLSVTRAVLVSSAEPTSASSPGRIDSQFFSRLDPLFQQRFPPDNVVFSKDIAAGPGVFVSGTQVGDRWTWRYYSPGRGTSGTPDETCFFEIEPPGGPLNPTSNVALVQNCAGSSVWQQFPGGCPCNPTAGIVGGLGLAGTSHETQRGQWNALIDYTNPGGAITLGIVQVQFELRQSPAIVLIHGWRSSCQAMEYIQIQLTVRIGLPAGRVACFNYDHNKGVRAAAVELDRQMQLIRGFMGLGATEEVDLVAHSLGGLVARYYVEEIGPAAPIGSISMLGTPNTGANVIRVRDYLCPGWGTLIVAGWNLACDIGDYVLNYPFVDAGGQSVKDMKPGSSVLKALNTGFQLPLSPVYQAHVGLNGGNWGSLHPFTPGDCVVEERSAQGPGRVFQATEFRYPSLSHTTAWINCKSTSLTNDSQLVDNLVMTVREVSSGGGAGSPQALRDAGARLEPLQATVQPPPAFPFSGTALDVVFPGQSRAHQISVPAGIRAVFALYWLDHDSGPQLGLTLRRPNGTVVNSGDGDVVQMIAATGDEFADVLQRGLVIDTPSTPPNGTWEFTVQATSVPAAGQAYLVAVIPETQVSLGLEAAEPDLTPGQPQVVRATLFDGTTPIAATMSTMLLPATGSPTPLQLVDDGNFATNGDKVANDKIYSAKFNAGVCGGYRVHTTATGGGVSREQFAFFQVHVAGDAVRNPCIADDDADGLSDANELDVRLTDPLDRDTDDDGCRDGADIGFRSPLNFWDFFDTPDVANARDGAISAGDLARVVQRFGSTGDAGMDPLSPPPAPPAYHTAFDRTPAGSYTGPPNGSITASDIALVVRQFGHTCA